MASPREPALCQLYRHTFVPLRRISGVSLRPATQWRHNDVTLIYNTNRYHTECTLDLQILCVCALLVLDRLEFRRLRADFFATRLYKVWFCFFTFICNSRTRGHSFKLFLPDSRVDCRQHFFAVRMLRIWNSLPNWLIICRCLLVVWYE